MPPQYPTRIFDSIKRSLIAACTAGASSFGKRGRSPSVIDAMPREDSHLGHTKRAFDSGRFPEASASKDSRVAPHRAEISQVVPSHASGFCIPSLGLGEVFQNQGRFRNRSGQL